MGYGEGVHAALATDVPNVAVLQLYTPRIAGGRHRCGSAGQITGEPETMPVSVTCPEKHMAALNGIGAVLGCAGPVANSRRGSEGIAASAACTGGSRCVAWWVMAVVDDYAHHPTEVRAVLTAARDVGDRGRAGG